MKKQQKQWAYGLGKQFRYGVRIGPAGRKKQRQAASATRRKNLALTRSREEARWHKRVTTYHTKRSRHPHAKRLMAGYRKYGGPTARVRVSKAEMAATLRAWKPRKLK
jgi:hypothetical protein